jgi:TPR repeat protein
MTQRGEGVQADPRAAARWLEIAANEGSPHAMFLLANACRAGAGVPKDEAKALALYAKAGELEFPAALQALAMAYAYGELGLTPDQDESRRYAMEAEHALKHPPSLP